MADINKRLDALEGEEGPKGEDIVITVVREQTIVTQDGERHTVPVKPTGFDEGQWSDAGNGNRMRVRTPRYDADHGIVRDREVTGD